MIHTDRPLRPHQVVAIEGIRNSLMSGKRRPILQAPCGFGKTEVAAKIIIGARAKLKRVTFCVPFITLVEQSFHRFAAHGIDAADMGIMQAAHSWRRPHCPIQIATAQTLSRRTLPETDLVIVDEVHLRYGIYDKWMEANPKLPFIGMSATPWSRGLGNSYDDLIKPTSLKDLMADGYLVRLKAYAPPSARADMTGVKTKQTVNGTDYDESQMSERFNQPKLVADIVTTWLTLGNNEPTICFAVNRAHAKSIFERFELCGVPAAYIDAHTPVEERDEIGRKLADGSIKVAVNIGTLTTGLDWIVRCLILARETKSDQLYTQIVGRVLRTEYADGFDLSTQEGRLASIAASKKPFAILLDHSATSLKLGMVTDIDHDRLHTGAKETKGGKAREKGLPLPKECPSCAGLIPADAQECPCCGAARPKASFREGDGQLEEIAASGLPRGSKGQSLSTKDLLAAMGKPAIWGQLQYLKRERDWSDGRTAHAYRDIFGVWPRGLDDDHREIPCYLLTQWLRAKAIAWVRSKQNPANAAKANTAKGGVHA